jgi:hypothetical protein
MASTSDNRFTADHLITSDEACSYSEARCRHGDCRTKPIVDGFYQCLLDRSDCNYSTRLGISCLCTSPHRPEYSI